MTGILSANRNEIFFGKWPKNKHMFMDGWFCCFIYHVQMLIHLHPLTFSHYFSINHSIIFANADCMSCSSLNLEKILIVLKSCENILTVSSFIVRNGEDFWKVGRYLEMKVHIEASRVLAPFNPVIYNYIRGVIPRKIRNFDGRKNTYVTFLFLKCHSNTPLWKTLGKQEVFSVILVVGLKRDMHEYEQAGRRHGSTGHRPYPTKGLVGKIPPVSAGKLGRTTATKAAEKGAERE